MPTPPYNTVLGIRGHHSSGLFLNATFEHFRATNKTHRQFLKADLESIFTVRFQELGQRTHSVWQYVRYPECFQKLPLSNVPHADEAGWCRAAIRFIYLYRWLNDSTPGTRTPPRPQQSLPRPLCPSVAWDPSPSPALCHSRNRRCTWSKVCCLKSVFSSLLTEKKTPDTTSLRGAPGSVETNQHRNSRCLFGFFNQPLDDTRDHLKSPPLGQLVHGRWIGVQ